MSQLKIISIVLFAMAPAAVVSQDGPIQSPETIKDRLIVDESWLAKAKELERRGFESRAIEAYRSAGNSPLALISLARLTKLDDPDKAAAQYSEAAALYAHGGDVVASQNALCDSVRLSGDVSTLRQLLRCETRTPVLANQLSELVRRCGPAPTLAADLRSWVEQFPDRAGPVAALALCTGTEGPLVEWLERHSDPSAYAALIRLRTSEPHRLFELIRQTMQLTATQPERSRAIMTGFQSEPAAIAALMKNYPSPRARNTGSSFDCEVIRALAFAGDCPDLAETTLKSRLRSPSEETARIKMTLMYIYNACGQFDRTEELSRRCLVEYPKLELEIYLPRTRALMHLNREDQALAAVAEVVRLSREYIVMARLQQIEVLSWFGKHDESHTAAKELIAEFPDATSERRIRLRLATLAENRGDLTVAQGHLLRVLELNPKDAEALNNLGYFWAENNQRLDDAEQLCRMAVELGRPSADPLDPGGDDAAYRDSLGWVYFRQGRLIAAQEQLERALSLPGGKLDGVIWDHYGDVLAARGFSNRARVAWLQAHNRIAAKRSYRDDPRPADIRRKIDSLPPPP